MSFVLLLLEGTILGKVGEFDHDWRMATMLLVLLLLDCTVLL